MFELARLKKSKREQSLEKIFTLQGFEISDELSKFPQNSRAKVKLRIIWFRSKQRP